MRDAQDCPIADQIEGLDDENRRAWRLYRDLASRLAMDLHCGGEVLRRLTAGVSDEDFSDVWGRVTLLYDVLNPVETRHDA